MFDLFGIMLGHLYIVARRFLSTTCIHYESFRYLINAKYGINAMEMVYMYGHKLCCEKWLWRASKGII